MPSFAFTVPGVPPKKREWSIWTHQGEAPRVRDLRLAAAAVIPAPAPRKADVRVEVVVYGDPIDCDLGNLVGGILDALQSAHSHTLATVIPNHPWAGNYWMAAPANIQPHQAIAYVDDNQVIRLEAERRPPLATGKQYDVTVSWP